jgi:hypothetical protein
MHDAPVFCARDVTPLTPERVKPPEPLANKYTGTGKGSGDLKVTVSAPVFRNTSIRH